MSIDDDEDDQQSIIDELDDMSEALDMSDELDMSEALDMSEDDEVGQAIDDDDDMSDDDELVSVCCATPGTVLAAIPPVSNRTVATRSSFFISTSAECGFARWGKLRADASGETQTLTTRHDKMMERSRGREVAAS